MTENVARWQRRTGILAAKFTAKLRREFIDADISSWRINRANKSKHNRGRSRNAKRNSYRLGRIGYDFPAYYRAIVIAAA